MVICRLRNGKWYHTEEETRSIIPLYPAYMAKSRSAGKKSGNGGKRGRSWSTPTELWIW